MTTNATTTTNGAAPTGTAPTHAEAPAAASVKVLDTEGREWILTLRTSTAAELLSRVTFLGEWLTAHSWTPATSKPAAPATATATAAPICPEHGSPMRPAKRGGWFCPVEVGRHPQSGKALYCEHRA